MSPWTCPQCRYPQEKALRAEALERLAENLGLVVMCRHLKCTTRHPIAELAVHETQECPYAKRILRDKQQQHPPRRQRRPSDEAAKIKEADCKVLRDMAGIGLVVSILIAWLGVVLLIASLH